MEASEPTGNIELSLERGTVRICTILEQHSVILRQSSLNSTDKRCHVFVVMRLICHAEIFVIFIQQRGTLEKKAKSDRVF